MALSKHMRCPTRANTFQISRREPFRARIRRPRYVQNPSNLGVLGVLAVRSFPYLKGIGPRTSILEISLSDGPHRHGSDRLHITAKVLGYGNHFSTRTIVLLDFPPQQLMG